MNVGKSGIERHRTPSDAVPDRHTIRQLVPLAGD